MVNFIIISMIGYCKKNLLKIFVSTEYVISQYKLYKSPLRF